jgi:hypothetical protein
MAAEKPIDIIRKNERNGITAPQIQKINAVRAYCSALPPDTVKLSGQDDEYWASVRLFFQPTING